MTIASAKLCGKIQLFAPHILLMMKLCHVYEGYGTLFSIMTDNLLAITQAILYSETTTYRPILGSGATDTTEGSSILCATTEVGKVNGSYRVWLNGP